MNKTQTRWLVLTAAALLCATAAQAASRSVDMRKPADLEGQVEIDAVAGSVSVAGWDRPEIEVTGTIGDRVERVDLSTTNDHATVRVVLPAASVWGGDTSADLVVHIPRKSVLTSSVVSADLTTHDLSGEQRLRTVSGKIDTMVARDAHLSTISGNLHVVAQPGAGSVELESISGAITMEGPVEEIRSQTVSGNTILKLTSIKNARLKTISGDVRFSGSLPAGGRIEAGSVSGDLRIGFNATQGADYDIDTHTGTIVNCFGPAPQTPTYGPGSQLVFRDGDGSGRVHLHSMSGNIELCNHL
jgi:putative adhesin